MRLTIAATAAAAVFALPAAASADVTFQAVDGTLPDGSDNVWAPNVATVKAGDTVTWSFAGTALAHNVKSNTTGWTFSNAPMVGNPPVTQTFSTPGTYTFLCELHASPMRGTLTVTDAAGTAPPPPPPPPLSEQPFANDAPPLSVVEVRDVVRPRLDRVRVSRVTRGARVRFRVSEAGTVALKLTRGAKTVKTRTVHTRKGTNRVTLRGLRAGGYRVELRARDLAGNTARTTRARVTVRS